MKVQILVRPYDQVIGLSRYTSSLVEAMRALQIDFHPVSPEFPWPVRGAGRLMARLGYDLKAFFLTYPISAKFSRGAITHLPAQQVATLLWRYPRLHPVIVTVHDIIPFLVRQDAEQSTFRHPADRFFDQLAMKGLERCDAIISDSEFTKNTIVAALSCSPEKIFVVPLGVRQDQFHPIRVPPGFYARYQLDEWTPYILYVGSDNPRKNLPRLIDAFDRVRQEIPAVKLVKVGLSQNAAQAQLIREKIRKFGLSQHIITFENIPDDDLAYFYNLASLFVFPSLFEGFGLPPLEAMACGTPVVCSRAASLPEVVGDAALLVDPSDIDALAGAIRSMLSDESLRNDFREKGLKRAARFTWERTAMETIQVYRHFA